MGSATDDLIAAHARGNQRHKLEAALREAMTGTIGSNEMDDLQIWGYVDLLTQYDMATNALAVAALTVKLVLPAFTDFAQKAEIDLPLQITETRITKSKLGKFGPTVMVIVDGRHQFNWHSWENDKGLGMKADLLMGSIHYYDNSNALSRLAGKRAVLRALTEKQSLITTNEAREIALSFLAREGYDLRKAKLDPPRVIQATYQDDASQPVVPLPGYIIRFIKKGVKKPEWHDSHMEIEVSGLTKKITRFSPSPFVYKAAAVDLRSFQP
jgi:hypothetical protein